MALDKELVLGVFLSGMNLMMKSLLPLGLATSFTSIKGLGNFGLLQGLLGPFGPKVEKKNSESDSRASRPRGSETVRNESKTSRNSLKIVVFDSFLDSILDFSEPWGRKAPPFHFRTFCRLWARRAQMTPVADQSFHIYQGLVLTAIWVRKALLLRTRRPLRQFFYSPLGITWDYED